MWKSALIMFAVILALTVGCLANNEITVISWNVESGGADPAIVAQRIAAMQGVDLWGFCEVQDQNWAQAFEQGAEDGEPGDFDPILISAQREVETGC